MLPPLMHSQSLVLLLEEQQRKERIAEARRHAQRRAANEIRGETASPRPPHRVRRRRPGTAPS